MKLPTKCPTDQDPLVYGLLYGINLATKNGPLPPLDGSTLPPDTGSATSTAPPRLGKTDSAMSGKDFQPTLTLERKRPVSAEPSLSKIATKVLGPKPFAWRSDRPYLQAEKFEVISHPEFPAAVVGGKRAKRACIEFKSYFPSLFQHVRATTPIGTRNPLVADRMCDDIVLST